MTNEGAITLYRSGSLIPADQISDDYSAESKAFDRFSKKLGFGDGTKRTAAAYFVRTYADAQTWIACREAIGIDTDIHSTQWTGGPLRAHLVEHYENFARAHAEARRCSADMRQKLMQKRDEAIRAYHSTAITLGEGEIPDDGTYEILVPLSAVGELIPV